MMPFFFSLWWTGRMEEGSAGFQTSWLGGLGRQQLTTPSSSLSVFSPLVQLTLTLTLINQLKLTHPFWTSGSHTYTEK